MSAPEARPLCIYCRKPVRVRLARMFSDPKKILGEGTTHYAHWTCDIRHLVCDLENRGPGNAERLAAMRAAKEIGGCTTPRPSAWKLKRFRLRAQIESMPEPTVPQHPLGYVPSDEDETP